MLKVEKKWTCDDRVLVMSVCSHSCEGRNMVAIERSFVPVWIWVALSWNGKDFWLLNIVELLR